MDKLRTIEGHLCLTHMKHLTSLSSGGSNLDQNPKIKSVDLSLLSIGVLASMFVLEKQKLHKRRIVLMQIKESPNGSALLM